MAVCAAAGMATERLKAVRNKRMIFLPLQGGSRLGLFSSIYLAVSQTSAALPTAMRYQAKGAKP